MSTATLEAIDTAISERASQEIAAYQRAVNDCAETGKVPATSKLCGRTLEEFRRHVEFAKNRLAAFRELEVAAELKARQQSLGEQRVAEQAKLDEAVKDAEKMLTVAGRRLADIDAERSQISAKLWDTGTASSILNLSHAKARDEAADVTREIQETEKRIAWCEAQLLGTREYNGIESYRRNEAFFLKDAARLEATLVKFKDAQGWDDSACQKGLQQARIGLERIADAKAALPGLLEKLPKLQSEQDRIFKQALDWKYYDLPV
ncbi:MAG: hypothetical protein EXS05_11740 [Planctomycetaceae bacterium]|nr:hypothetical protein [Planctomycetaceae bacterium]